MYYEIYEVLGRPVPLARHRHAGKICYDPQRAVKRAVVDTFRATFKGVVPVANPFMLELHYYMPIPSSCSVKKAKEMVGTAHSSKPDLSNLIKFTEDVFNGVIWEDDSLVWKISAKKTWAVKGMTYIGVMMDGVMSESGGELMMDSVMSE